MKYMTGKAKMMVTGIALGTVAAGGMAALIAAGKVGVGRKPGCGIPDGSGGS